MPNRYASDVAEFKIVMGREFPNIKPHLLSATLSALLRLSNQLDKLAVAQCNGDWPADNGERAIESCPECESGFVASSFRRVPYLSEGNGGRVYYKRMCPDCYAQHRVRKLCEPLAIVPIFGGDPRGCVLKLKVPSGKTNDWGHEGICVPAREH